ncbi:MAG: tetratricopeptide repeat protein [Kiritimatiellae bacterium]|nr:tetratricopeptide repeat protein [Kiritimatiellia bacterium]
MHLRTVLFSALAAAFAAVGCSRVPPNAASEGQKALRAGDYERAIPLLRAAAKAHPKEAAVFYNLGTANFRADHNRAAEEAFDRAVELSRDTDDWKPLVARAETRRRRGNLDGAVNDYQAALGKANRVAGLVAGLAACEMDRGNAGTAFALLEEALTTDPADPVALYNAGVLHASGRLPGRSVSEEHTEAARLLQLFVVSKRSLDFEAQRADAIRRLGGLASRRPPELQEKIDRLLMEAARAQSPAFAFEKARQAWDLDRSNSAALSRMERFAHKKGDDRLAGRIAECGRFLFPGDRRFE